MPQRYTNPGFSITLWEMSSGVNRRSLAAAVSRSASILLVSSSYISTARLSFPSSDPAVCTLLMLYMTCHALNATNDLSEEG